MKILIAHNAYQHSGGEDAVVDAEIALLRGYGHDVEVYQRHNDELETMPRANAVISAIWSRQSAHEMEHLCEIFQPDLIHAHNTFPLISPSFSWMAARRNIPVVQTLHNFRLLCSQAMFLREGKVCEDCLGKLPWRAVTRKCYRESTIQSAVVASMLATHRAIRTYRERVTRYIALNEFCRTKGPSRNNLDVLAAMAGCHARRSLLAVRALQAANNAAGRPPRPEKKSKLFFWRVLSSSQGCINHY